MTDALPSSYDPTQFESRLYRQWESSGVFQPRGQGDGTREPYCILLPPPNVTGTLHMGHAFQHTLMDALVRYHRMRGFDTLWQVGSDHAGIATEMVVARNLDREGRGETRDSLGRDGFIEKVWEWKAQSGDTIERQMRRLGASGDWSRSMFTMDPMAAEAVVEAFVRLHGEGLIYRGQRLVNWDPVLKTAISDLEVVNEEEDGFLWSIAYPLSDGSGTLVVATTRPETMLGDTAVMVHPDDERYAHLVGGTVTLPLTGRQIPIIADSYVDREFGTGVVKVTPAHDFNDYQVGQRHSLPLINIFTPDAVTNHAVPEQYRGLDRYEAREVVLADLEAQGLLVETKPHKLQVPRGDRTGQVIEPYLTDQWFVKMDGLAKRGMELVEGRDGKPGQIKFVPGNWINTYRHWLENIQDWCISRQLWWGHRIPAWYDEAGNIHVGRDEADARRRAGLGDDVKLTQDSDVLETWFSSALWPMSTMGWPNADLMTQRGFDRYLPSSVLVTGFDILFFWVARMIMATDHFVDEVPFRDVYITGLVRDAHGQKMSKSKGNILDPLDLIDGISLDDLLAKRTTGLMQPKMAEKIAKATRKEFPEGIPAFGADALRFTIAALAGHGRDIRFDLGRAEGYKNFCNKLWNATRFVLMNTESALTPTPLPQAGEGLDSSLLPRAGEGAPALNKHGADEGAFAPNPHTDAERWILARLYRVAAQAAQHFADYRFDLLSQTLYEFAWNDFCDWFVELAKPALNGDDAEAAASTRHTLLHVLERLLSLLHPLIPFVTEELWQQVAPRLGIAETTIMLRPYPRAGDLDVAGFDKAEADVEWLKAMVSALRRIRSELNVPPSKQIGLLLAGAGEADRTRIARFEASLRFLTKVESIDFIDDAATAPAAATAVVGELKLLVPLEGLVDLDAERVRLDKELKKVEAELAKSKGKLASETFVQNAPEAVVEQERRRLVDWTAQREALAAQRAKLG